MRNRLMVVLLMGATLNSCSTNSKSKIDDQVAAMATLECRAIQLREERFDLANRIRFAQDTLMKTLQPSEKLRLSNQLLDMNTSKQMVLDKSLVLADSIKQRLDSLMKHDLASPQAKKEFTDKLNAELKRRGCVEKE